MEISNINDLPKIPMLRTPVFRELEIGGKTVRVHKPRARQAAIVAQRLMESFGETLLRVFASPDKDLEAIFASPKEVRNAKLFKAMLAGGFMEKALARLRELGHEVGPDHLVWYFENALVGNVELDDYRFKSLEEMEEAGFVFSELVECMGATIELAIYPMSDDPDTDAGKSESKSEQPKARPAASRKKARRVSRPNAATRKAGQSVPMSSSHG